MLRRFMILAALPALLLAAAPARAEHGGKVDWVRDATVGLAKAKLESRVAMLYFTAEW